MRGFDGDRLHPHYFFHGTRAGSGKPTESDYRLTEHCDGFYQVEELDPNKEMKR